MGRVALPPGARRDGEGTARTRRRGRALANATTDRTPAGMDWQRTLQSFRTAAIWIGLAAAAFILWRTRDALLIAFGAILVAILLSEFAGWIARYTRLPRGPALLAATCVVLGLLGVTVWLFGTQMSGQLSDVMHRVQQSVEQIRSALSDQGLSGMSQELAQGGASMVGDALRAVLSVGLGFTEGLVVLVISAIYLAAQPRLYRDGLVQLFAPRLRPKAGEAVDLIGYSLKYWLVGQLILMVMVGVLSFAAMWLIGLPSPAGLGLIAGITEAVPYLGPFIGAIPAVLVALTQGFDAALWTLAAYLGIHLLEGYFVAPLIQHRFVTIPPALVLIGIVMAEMLFGKVGVVFAAPLTVAVFVAVKVLYVRDTLKQPTPVPGDDEGAPGPSA